VAVACGDLPLTGFNGVCGADGASYISDPDGNCCVRYLGWFGEQWNWNYNWLDNDWDSSNPSAVLATHFISLPSLRRESFVCAELGRGIKAEDAKCAVISTIVEITAHL